MSDNVSEKELKRRKYILTGPVYKVILYIAYPLIIYNFITFCYSFIDAYMVSSIDKTSVSAVFFFNQLSNVIRVIGIALCTGGGVVLSRCYGSGDFEKSKKIANILFYLVFFISFIIVGGSILLTPLIFEITNTTETLSQAGYEYFVIQILTIFFSALTTLYFSYERSKGKTTSILYLNIISMILKIIFTYLAVYVFKGGLAYVGLATLITQILLFVISMLDMMNKNNIFRITFKGICDLKYKTIVLDILKISYPLIISKLIFTVGKLSVSSLGIEYYNEDVVAALGLASTAASMTAFLSSAIEDSIGSLVSQSIGAKNEKRAQEIIKKSMILMVTVTFAITMILFIFKNDVLYMFVKDEDQEYQKLVTQVFSFEVFSNLTSGVGALLLGAMNGYGSTKPTIVANLSRLFVFRIPVLIILATVFEMPPYSIGLTMFISNFMYMITAIIVYVIFKNGQKYKNLKEKLLCTKSESELMI